MKAVAIRTGQHRQKGPVRLQLFACGIVLIDPGFTKAAQHFDLTVGQELNTFSFKRFQLFEQQFVFVDARRPQSSSLGVCNEGVTCFLDRNSFTSFPALFNIPDNFLCTLPAAHLQGPAHVLPLNRSFCPTRAVAASIPAARLRTVGAVPAVN